MSNQISAAQKELVKRIESIYQKCGFDRRLLAMELVNSRQASSEREANMIIDGFLRIRRSVIK